MDPETLNAIKDLGGMAWMGILSYQIVRWRLREGKAKKNGDGKTRRLTDGNPGNPHSWFDHIESNCARHETDFKDLRERIDKHRTEIQKDVRGLRDRVIMLEVQHQSAHSDKPKR